MSTKSRLHYCRDVYKRQAVIYNQIVFLPNQKRELALLDKKKNRHASIPNPSNQMAAVRHNQLQKPLLFQPSFPPIVKYSVITFAAASHPLHKATK